MTFGIGIAIVSQSGAARADAAEVEALIAKGNQLRRAGTPGPALPYFQKAYELARTPRTTGQLGLAELAAGYPVEAAEHLAAALQSPKDPSIVKYHHVLADALAMARSQIGELAIDGNRLWTKVIGSTGADYAGGVASGRGGFYGAMSVGADIGSAVQGVQIIGPPQPVGLLLRIQP